jgi:hypothetical protein
LHRLDLGIPEIFSPFPIAGKEILFPLIRKVFSGYGGFTKGAISPIIYMGSFAKAAHSVIPANPGSGPGPAPEFRTACKSWIPGRASLARDDDFSLLSRVSQEPLWNQDVFFERAGKNSKMKIIKEIYCTKCRKKQVTDVADLIEKNLFWSVCEFCHRYGLTIVTRHKATFPEYLEAFFYTLGFRVVQTEAFLKDLLKDRKPL